MLQRFNTLGRRLSAAFTEDDLIALVGNAPLIKVGNTWRVKLPDSIIVTNTAATVPIGNICFIYTVTAGKLPVLSMATIAASTPGFIVLRYNSVNLVAVRVVANETVVISFPNGLVLPTTGGSFDVLNSTGAISDMAGTVSLNEYTP